MLDKKQETIQSNMESEDFSKSEPAAIETQESDDLPF